MWRTKLGVGAYCIRLVVAGARLLTEAVTAAVTQTIPTGLTADAVGQNGARQGSAITWSAMVPAGASLPLTMAVHLDNPSAGAVVLPGASATLTDGEGNQSELLTTAPITLTPLHLLNVVSGLPGRIAPRATVSVPYTITNVAPVPVAL